MQIGKVKWFNDAKGYGFLTAQDLEEDVFVHFSAIAMSGFKTLRENALVEFELVANSGRLMASSVCPLLTNAEAD